LTYSYFYGFIKIIRFCIIGFLFDRWWFLVGLAIIFCFQKLDLKMGWSTEYAGNALMGPIFYFINMIFILSVTFYIGEYCIGVISLSIFSLLFYLTILKVRRAFLCKDELLID
jgi:hypothetical protein